MSQMLMHILQSTISLALLMLFFGIVGFGTVPLRVARSHFLILPIIGYAGVIVLSYAISANFNIAGSVAVLYVVLLFLMSFLLRFKCFLRLINDVIKDRQFLFFLAIIAISLCSLLLPSLMIGLKYFYGYVNMDFFYNSQDGWFMQSHSVNQFDFLQISYFPLGWSANYSGRIAVTLWTAFAAKFFGFDVLYFNSILLNTIVLLFALSMAVFCKEFFNFRHRTIIIAVLISIMSAGYVQAYCYYVLGQISAIPVFVVFCVFLKRFLDKQANNEKIKNLYVDIFILALLLNVLFVFYAILSFIAVSLLIFSYCLYHIKQLKKTILPLLFILLFSVIVFVFLRIRVIPETIHTILAWLHLSYQVVFDHLSNKSFIVFSEYLTEVFPALLFGLTNYVSSSSILYSLFSAKQKNILLFSMGLAAFFVTILVLKKYFLSSQHRLSARVIILSLLSLVVILSIGFFISFSGYGIFKIQTWFMPILMPLYIYYLGVDYKNATVYFLKSFCCFILFLNIITSINYLSNYFVPPHKIRFMNAKDITNNLELFEVGNQLKNYQGKISLFVKDSYGAVWLANLLRHNTIDKAAHDIHLLQESRYDGELCHYSNQDWKPSGVAIFNDDSLQSGDITSSIIGGKIIFKNNQFTVIDTKDLKLFSYIGLGSYPASVIAHAPNHFPTKFRWVSKGVEILIYSNIDRVATVKMTITPGFVDNHNQIRTFNIHTKDRRFFYTVPDTTEIILKNIALSRGLNCIAIDTPDKVTTLVRSEGFVRRHVPLDARFLNFAISDVKVNL